MKDQNIRVTEEIGSGPKWNKQQKEEEEEEEEEERKRRPQLLGTDYQTIQILVQKGSFG